MKKILFFAGCLAIMGIAKPVFSQMPLCDALNAQQKNVMKEAFSTMHPYDICDDTFERCLAQETPHPLVLRVANDMCRLIASGKPASELPQWLNRRAKSVLPQGKPSTFNLDDQTLAGDPASPIHVVVVACLRCPFCRISTPALYDEVTKGKLKGKVYIHFRPYPLKDHPGSTEGGLALFAAIKQQKFWPYLLKAFEEYQSFCPRLLPDWAESLGMDRKQFEQNMEDPKIREALVAAKQEGIRNKVKATPTLFINGHKYSYNLQPDVVLDVLEEVYERTMSSKTP